jgi:hypothetical protein
MTAASAAGTSRLGHEAVVRPGWLRRESSTAVTVAEVGVLIETDRLVLPRFSGDDLELLVELDSDLEVKRYIDGGAAVDRQELAGMLSWWRGHYERTRATGSGPPSRRRRGSSWDGSTCVPGMAPVRGSPSSGTDCGARRGDVVTRRRARGHSSIRRFGARRGEALRLDDGGQYRVVAGDGEAGVLRYERTFYGDWR